MENIFLLPDVPFEIAVYTGKYEREGLQMYSNVVNENIVYPSKDQSKDAEKGTEYAKKYWEHRKRLLKKYLMPQLDTSLLNTTRRRKQYPRRCCKSLVTRYQHRTQHLVQSECRLATSHTPTAPVLSPLTEELEQCVPNTAHALASNLKSCADTVQSVEATQEVLAVLRSPRTSSTDAVIFTEPTQEAHSTENTQDCLILSKN